MKTLIVDDDFTNRMILQANLQQYGDVHIAVDGHEAVQAVRLAFENDQQYDLICLDILMPHMNGHEALNHIRQIESDHGILLGRGAKVLMTTSFDDSTNLFAAFREQCDGFLVKPIDISKLKQYLETNKLIA